MTSVLAPTAFGKPSPSTDPRLSLATAAYLALFKGQSRLHTDSDLRVFLGWCTARDLDPLVAARRDLELYVRWLQETRRYKPSTVSRRTSVIAGFYRTCVIDAVLEHSPADYVRRPTVPPESRPWGSRTCSSKRCSPLAANRRTATTSLWWPCSACWGCASSKRPAPMSPTLARNTATASCGLSAKGPGSSWHRCRRQSGAPSTGPTTDAPSGRSCSTPAAPGWTGTTPPAGYAASPMSQGCGCPECTRTCSGTPSFTTMLDAGVDLRDVQIAARHADPRTTMRYDRARKNLDRHPNYILAAYMASGT